MFLYFDGDIIRKKIIAGDNKYFEQELCEATAENRTILLPKTVKGKSKKLNFTATQSFSPFGVYFNFSEGYVSISSYTTQTTYFEESFDKEKAPGILKPWIDKWISETTEDDLKEIEEYKSAKRQHQKFREGDFFTFKIGRRDWGFGRILIDVARLKKDTGFKQAKNYGLTNFMGKPLIVKVYHKISDTVDVNLDELAGCMALPPQAIMDNHFYYGEYKIISNKTLAASEYDEPLISYSQSINARDGKTVYLQYGLIYKETTISAFNKYLTEEEDNPYRNEGIGFGLKIDKLKQCITEKSNLPFWNTGHYYSRKDLRNPANTEIKREIFKFFGLDADKSYEENLKADE